MDRRSIARKDVAQFKTLGLLGDIFRLAMKLKEEGETLLPLHLGDPPRFDFPPLPSFKEGIVKSLEKQESFAYGNPKGYPPLLERIALMEGVDSHYVFTGNGVSDMMDKILNATAHPGTNILFPAPVFPPYMDLNTKNRVESRLYRCDPQSWQPILSSIEAKTDDQTAMILLNSPNNPTGAVYTEQVMRDVIDFAEFVNRKRKMKNLPPLCLIFDEIYSEHYYDQKPFDVKPYIEGKEITWIIFNGASKAYNLTGVRVGYAIVGGVEKDALREVMYNECILPLCMNSIFQEGFLAALEDPGREEYFARNRAKLKKRRDLMLDAFSKIPGISVVKPEGAFYMIVKMETVFDNDRDLGLALLSEEKICTSQLSGFFDEETMPDGTYLRLVILPPEHILEEAMEKFRRFMDKHGQS